MTQTSTGKELAHIRWRHRAVAAAVLLVVCVFGIAVTGYISVLLTENARKRVQNETLARLSEARARLEGDINIAQATRARVNSLVAGTLERGDSLGQLQKALREDVCFSRSRARTVARTETATALGEGGMEAAKAQDMDEKHWVTQGDSHVDIEHCLNNEKQGWIKIGNPFQSGHDKIPAHPNCRCTTLYRNSNPPDDVDPFEGLDDDGALLLRQDDDTLRRITAGDVFRPPSR